MTCPRPPCPVGLLLRAGWATLSMLMSIAVAGAQDGSVDRFAGWDRIVDEGYEHDPDERPAFGFSVRASSNARLAMQRAHKLLAEGDAEAAAERLRLIVAEYPDHVVPVGGGAGRWVGAAEWALYLLHAAIPAAIVADAEPPGRSGEIDQARAWRDAETLGRLARELEGLPSGRRAGGLQARLLAERGDIERARVAANRALQMGASGMAPLLATLPEAAPPLADASRVGRTLDGAWTHPLSVASLADRNPFRLLPDSDEAPLAAIAPVVEDGVVYLADSVSVTALELHSGRELWKHVGPILEATEAGTKGVFSFDVYADADRERAVSPVQLCQPVLTEDLVLATVQVLHEGHVRDLHRFDGRPIDWPLPRRRVHALDKRSGEVSWVQERPELGPEAFVNRFDVHGPVTVQGGVVYVSGSITEGSINAYIAAFGASNGNLLWRTFVCSGQQELTMFNRPFQEHVTGPPTVHDGTLFVVSNLGVIAAVDAWSGRLRWLRGYQTTRRHASRSPDYERRRAIFWVNEPPVIEAGVLLATPLDSDELLALDPQTGRQLWGPMKCHGPGSGMRHQVVGTGRGRALLVGEDTLESLDARSGRQAEDELFASLGLDIEGVMGPAVRTGELLLLPARSHLVVVDTERWDVDHQVPWPDLFSPSLIRRVVPAGLVTLLTDNWDLMGALDTDGVVTALSSEAEESLDAELVLAEVLLSTDRLAAARSHFERVLAEGDEGQQRQARTGRMTAVLRLAREGGTSAAWDDVLEVSRLEQRLWDHADEALLALHDLGARESVDAWLWRLEDDLGNGGDPRRRALFEIVVRLGLRRHDPIKQRLAHGLGEDAFARALAGESAVPREPDLPRLPPRDASLAGREVVTRGILVLPRVRGRADDRWRDAVVATVKNQGTMLLFDTVTGETLWQRALPGDVLSVNSSNSHFILDGNRLLVAAGRALESMSLEDGRRLWARELDNFPADVHVVDGQIVCLVSERSAYGPHAVLGFGLETGTLTSRLALDDGTTYVERSGGKLYVFTRPGRLDGSDVGPRLLGIDPAMGRVSAAYDLPEDTQFVQQALHERGALLLSGSGTTGKRFDVWDPERGVSWSREAPVATRAYVPPTSGLLALALPSSSPGSARYDEVLAVDLLTGRETVTVSEPSLLALPGQDKGPTPRMVLLDNSTQDRLVVVEAGTDAAPWDVKLPEPLSGSIQLVHGADGFVLATDTYDRRTGRTLSLVVVRGEGGEDRYSIELETYAPNGQLQVTLTDGAVVLAHGPKIWTLRSDMR